MDQNFNYFGAGPSSQGNSGYPNGPQNVFPPGHHPYTGRMWQQQHQSASAPYNGATTGGPNSAPMTGVDIFQSHSNNTNFIFQNPGRYGVNYQTNANGIGTSNFGAGTQGHQGASQGYQGGSQDPQGAATFLQSGSGVQGRSGTQGGCRPFGEYEPRGGDGPQGGAGAFSIPTSSRENYAYDEANSSRTFRSASAPPVGFGTRAGSWRSSFVRNPRFESCFTPATNLPTPRQLSGNAQQWQYLQPPNSRPQFGQLPPWTDSIGAYGNWDFATPTSSMSEIQGSMTSLNCGDLYDEENQANDRVCQWLQGRQN